MECTSNRSSDADLDDTHTSEELDHRELPPPPSPPSPPSSLPAPDEAVEELCHRLRAVELEHEPDRKASSGPVTRGSRTCELPEELWRKIFIHASPGRIFDTAVTNNVEEQEGSLCGLGFWRIAYVSQWTRYQLCLVSRQFNAICTPLLYRDLRLTTEKSIIGFARTLAVPSLPLALRETGGRIIYRPDLRIYPVRLDVDLVPYLNLKDDEGNPIMELDEDGQERQIDYSADEMLSHPIRVLAHLILHLPNLRLFLFDSTENLATLPSIILTALARARCAPLLKDLDWFPLSRWNIVAFFELLTAAKNLEHLEIGEAQDDFWISRHPQVTLPELHTLAISGDGASTCSVFAKADLPALTRLTHWSNFDALALSTLEMLCQAHGRKLHTLSLWSPGGRLAVTREAFDLVVSHVLSLCPNLKFLELDIFAPHPMPFELAPHPSITTISLGLELHPLKEREDPDHPFLDSSPMSELVLSITRRAFPRLESLHLLSLDLTAMFSGARDVWAEIPRWCRHARKERFVLRDGWGDAVKEDDWRHLETGVNSPIRPTRRTASFS